MTVMENITNLFNTSTGANSWAYSMLEKNMEFYKYHDNNQPVYKSLFGLKNISDNIKQFLI